MPNAEQTNAEKCLGIIQEFQEALGSLSRETDTRISALCAAQIEDGGVAETVQWCSKPLSRDDMTTVLGTLLGLYGLHADWSHAQLGMAVMALLAKTSAASYLKRIAEAAGKEKDEQTG